MSVLTEGFLQILQGREPVADTYNGDPASDVVNLALYEHVVFVIYEGVGTTGTVTITVEECTSAAGAGATAIPFKYRVQTTKDTWGAVTAAAAAGFGTTAGSNHVYIIEVSASELSEGSNFVRLQLTELVDAAVLGGVLVILAKPRFGTAVPKTAIS